MSNSLYPSPQIPYQLHALIAITDRRTRITSAARRRAAQAEPVETPWLRSTPSPTCDPYGKPVVPCNNLEFSTRLRVRAALRWRSRWLAAYALGFSKFMACRKAKISFTTLQYHLENDPDFPRQAEEAKEHAVDLLHARAFARCVASDIDPVHWQGVVVDYVRKYPERLTIEMLPAHMSNTFKTPGTGQVNVETGDKILVMDEATRAKLIERKAERLRRLQAAREALPASDVSTGDKS